jgi:hypothetical protein
MRVHSTGDGSELAGAAQTEGMGPAPEGNRGSGPEEERSLTARIPGREPWILRLEESILLSQAERDDDGLAGEVAYIAD